MRYYQKSPEEFSEEDKLTLLDLQNKLDGLYRHKAEGAFVRSRRRWLEEGEQNSAFSGLKNTDPKSTKY